ncbi:MAG: hypothetical protein AB4050_02795 [Synechococcus sp.]
MQIGGEQLMTLVVRLLAAIVLLYCVWPLLVRARQWYQHHVAGSRPTQQSGQTSEVLSHYEQLVKLLNDDIQLTSLLLQKLAYQMPDQTDDWYCRMALMQMQLWIVNRISADRNDPGFGERQMAIYRAKYCDRPSWWVYRKLAVDYQLFRDGFNRPPSNPDYQVYPFTKTGST